MSEDHYFEDLVSRALREELALINKHVPYERPSLCDLLSMDVPHYVSRDGSSYLVDPRELLLLRELAGEEACSLRIPIVIEYRLSLGESTYVVREPAASRVIAKFLGIEGYGEELIMYRSQLSAIRRKFRTTTTIVFIPA